MSNIEPVTVLYPASGGTIETDVPMRGKAHPGGEVFIDNVPTTGVLQSAEVNATGDWQETFPGKGARKIRFIQKVNGQRYDQPGVFEFNVGAAPAPAPDMEQPNSSHSDLDPQGAFLVNARLYNDVDKVLLQVGEAGSDAMWTKEMEPHLTQMYKWYLLLDVVDSLPVGYYFARAWTIKNGVASRPTPDVPFRVGMPS